MKKAALYIQGRIVTGSCHLDAFEQLSDEEKSARDLSSGFFDEATGEFQGFLEEDHFFRKEILLLRHGHVENDKIDPDLSANGVAQVLSIIPFILELELGGFVGQCSPALRCVRTAQIIFEHTGIRFRIEPCVFEAPPYLKVSEHCFLPNRSDKFPEHNWPEATGWDIGFEDEDAFISRVGQVLRNLPKKSIIVSHNGFVTNMARLALCDSLIARCGVPTASLTHIENRELKCLGRNL